MFKPLTKGNIGSIIKLMMDELNSRLVDRRIKVALTPEAESFVVEHGYDPVYGARPLRRFLQKYVETLSAKLILSGDVGAEDTIEIYVNNDELCARTV
jgi:ATP-dependent Clp protease ATP-binding subunit ClpB